MTTIILFLVAKIAVNELIFDRFLNLNYLNLKLKLVQTFANQFCEIRLISVPVSCKSFLYRKLVDEEVEILTFSAVFSLKTMV